jgi:glycosyltransferase involved in cell wall biosynthesis
MRTELGIGDEPVVALVSKHLERKRFDLLIEAVRRTWQVRPDIHLVLAGGKTPYTQEIQRMVENLGPVGAGKVHLLAEVEEEEKARILAACDVFALPSLRDSFGLVFLEAWAARKPVIGVDGGAIPGVVRHGTDGLLVSPHDAEELAAAVLQLLDDPELARRLGQNGFEKTRREHTWEAVGRRVRTIYEEICRGAGGGPSKGQWKRAVS